tara:strand:- start:184 stop:912 length:729 start_codon:yes stop_codon:yes gene_type:complete
MPNITLPNYPFTDGTAPTGTDISENLYKVTAGSPVSYEVINGHLDVTNLDTSWAKINRTSVQYNTLSISDQFGSTANLDYIGKLFPGYTPSTAQAEIPDDDITYSDLYLGVPGLGASFYLPYRAVVIFTWNVMWTNDGQTAGGSDNVGYQSNMRLFLNGAMQSSSYRRVAHAVMRTDISGAASVPSHFGKDKNRYWNGHFTVELDAGFHTASIRVLANANVKQTRVFNRGFRYLAFHRPVGT